MKPRFGLDLGRASIQLVRWDGGKVRGEEERLDPALAPADRHAALVASLQLVAARLGARPRQELHLAVPRAEAIVKRLVLPQVPDEELDALVRFQAQRELPFPLDEVALAWGREEGLDQGGQPVLYAAVRSSILDGLKSVVLEAGFTPGSLIVSSQAAARTLAIQGGAQADEVLLVEVGQGTSDIVVLERGRLSFSRSASVGCGTEESGWRERLKQEIARSLVAARAAAHNSRRGSPDAVWLAGGGASSPEVRAALQEQIGREPRVLDGLHVAGEPSDPSGPGARFAVARGLADPTPTPGVLALDLAGLGKIRAEATDRRRRVVQVAGGVALALVGALAAQQVVAGRSARVADLRQQRAALTAPVQRAKRLQRELELAQRWSARRGRELEVLLRVAQALPPEEAYLTQLRWSEGGGVRLTGRAKEWDAVGRFLTSLEADPLVERATFDAIRQPREKGELGVEFSGLARLAAEETP